MLKNFYFLNLGLRNYFGGAKIATKLAPNCIHTHQFFSAWLAHTHSLSNILFLSHNPFSLLILSLSHACTLTLSFSLCIQNSSILSFHSCLFVHAICSLLDRRTMAAVSFASTFRAMESRQRLLENFSASYWKNRTTCKNVHNNQSQRALIKASVWSIDNSSCLLLR